MSRPFRLLKASIEAGDLKNLQKRVQALEKPFQDALCVAARKGFVEAVPVLWDRLSPSGQQRFFDAENSDDDNHDYLPPLHEAVKHGHLDMVQLLFGAFEFNINQKDRHGKTPLFYATNNLEMTRFLLENGADATQKDRHGKTPIHSVIRDGNPEILSIMLEHVAGVGWYGEGMEMTADDGTSLHELLCDDDKSRETKVVICQLLVDHATENRDTLLFLKSSLEFAIDQFVEGYDEDIMHTCIILEAGVVPSSQALYIAIRGEDVSLCQLLVRHGGNPFLPVQDDTGDDEDDEDEEEDEHAATSPFLAAARLQDILIFDYFLDLWNNEHFAASQGKNANGDYPLHVICRDPHVSLQVIVLMVARHVDAVTTLSGQDGLFPFQIASVANVDLDIIFYLLKLCPDALRRFRLLAVADPVPSGNMSSEPGKKKKAMSKGHDGMGIIPLEDFNALRDEKESLQVEKDAVQAEKDAAVEAMKSLQAEIEKLQQDLAAATATATTTTTLHDDKADVAHEATT